MKLRFSSTACPNWHLQKISECVKLHGFDGVELRVDVDSRHISPYATLSNARLIGRVFRRDGTPIFALKASMPLSFQNRTAIVEKRDEILRVAVSG